MILERLMIESMPSNITGLKYRIVQITPVSGDWFYEGVLAGKSFCFKVAAWGLTDQNEVVGLIHFPGQGLLPAKELDNKPFGQYEGSYVSHDQ